MNQYIINRQNLVEKMKDKSCVILFSGRVFQKSGDQDFPFEVNKNFYYLTGINQENVILMIVKSDKIKEYLFIEENDLERAKCIGMKLTKEEASTISGIENICYLESFDKMVYQFYNPSRKNCDELDTLYLDLERRSDLDYYNLGLTYSQKFKEMYPEIKIENAYPKIIRLRMNKSNDEIENVKESIEVTKIALENVMKHLKPGLYEYQVETFFDSEIKFHGQKDPAFTTICATGKNATILHYVKNNTKTKDNDLILFDLGCRTNFYVSDISRTYPVNGKFTARQKQIYEIVLDCNKKCIEFLKPGITWDEYNDFANSILIAGLKKLKLIKHDNEFRKYYWHSIGHSIGLDTHDPDIRTIKFFPGMMMTVEPGLYIEEEGIGIRIEDNVLITKDGCINLSKDIIKEINDIENFMKK